MLLTVLLVLLVLAVIGGGWGHSQAGPISWSPLGLLLVVLLVLYLTGHLTNAGFR